MPKRGRGINSPETAAATRAAAVSTYYSPYWRKWISRKITPPGGAPSEAQVICRALFAQAVALIKHQPAELQIAAYEFTKGTKYLPRDIQMAGAFGVLWMFTDQNGVTWSGARTMYPSIQSMLNSIGAVAGGLVASDGNTWNLLSPGAPGKILAVNATGDGLEWTDAAPPAPDVQSILDQLTPDQGDVIYYDGTDWVVLPAGAADQIMQVDAGNNPEWADLSAHPEIATIIALIAAVSATSSNAAMHPGFVPGRFYFGPTACDSGTQSAITVNTLVAYPFYVPRQQTFNTIGIDCTTLASGKSIELAIYADADGAPAALVHDCGTVSVNTSGFKEVTALGLTLAAGWYWLAVASDGTPSLRRTVGSVSGSVQGWLMGNTNGDSPTATRVGVTGAWTFAAGAAPDPFPAWTATNTPNLIYLKV